MPSKLRRSATLLAAVAVLALALGCGSDNDGNAVAPGNVTTLSAVGSGDGIHLAWTNPADADYGLTLVAWFPGLPDAVPVQGATYGVSDPFGSGRVIFVGAASAHVDAGRDGCGGSYAAWSQDLSGRWSAAPAVAVLPPGGAYPAPTAPPSGLTATVTPGGVVLDWINPAPATGYSQVRVVRTTPVPPTGPSGGITLATADVATWTDDLRGLLPNTTYWYGVYACNECGACESVGSLATVRPTLVQALQGGGYTIHWRHAAASTCTDRTDLGPAATTSVPDWWKSCDRNCPPGGNAYARQIDDPAGIQQSQVIGNDLRARGIPITRMISSEFCRNVQTAENMAFPIPIELRQDVTYFVYNEAARCSATMDLLREVPASGNTAIIGHAGFTCPVLDTLLWGEAAIYKPDGAGGVSYIARVPSNGWLSLP